MSIEIDNQNRAMFADVVRQYQNLVSATTFSITGNLQQSEDLAQETFITAWQNFETLREPEKLPGWLCSIARNLAHSWVRKAENQRRTELATPLDEIAAPTVENEAEREEQATLLWNTIKYIPETYREPLVMYYRQSQSVAEIAAALEITEANARQRIARGRTFLKEEIERKVETALVKLRPNEHFTAFVLAAIPIAATGKQTLAASSAGVAAAQSASSGGAGAGQSLFAGISSFLATFFGSILPTIFIAIGIVLGIWNGIRNAPTLRARRLMLKVALGYFIASQILMLAAMLVIAGLNYAVGSDHHIIPEREEMLMNVCYGLYFAMMLIVPVVVIISSCFINRKWRKIVEEDSANLDSQNLDGSMLSIYRWGATALIFFLVFHAVLFYMDMPRDFFIIPSTILLFSVSLFYCAVKIVKNPESFAKAPPRLPNLLQILTGEEKSPRGFRNRINFWGDVTGIGWGLFFMHFMLFGFYFNQFRERIVFYNYSLGNVFEIMMSLILLVYFLFVVFFAGIPRKRYWGMIFIGASILAIDIGIYCMISESLTHPRGSERWMVFGLSAWYLLCFPFLGVAGLLIFRKSAKPTTEIEQRQGDFDETVEN